ncbi:MAG: TraR/DksA C4-type zinc finger protein [Flavobacteriaceae bacterium]|nr:TraR/DksA C4-type zinc finger protein [Flavobacteriaceae bacterium]
MNLHDRETIVTRLTAEITKTKAAIAQYAELSKPIAPENAIGRVSRMDAINNKSVNEAALKQAQQKLKNLQVALSNVDAHDFGHCDKCRQAIPIGRIMLMPHARFCVHCAS